MTTVTNNSPQAINTSLFSLEMEIEALKQNLERIKASLGIIDKDVPEGSGNLAATATAHKITTYRNGLTIPYQMDNTNDGGLIRVRGTSEDNCIFELGTWDDSGDGETIQFNYYPTTSKDTPTHSVSVPKKSGTIALTSDVPTKTSELTNDSGFITSATFDDYVPTSRTVNGKALSSDISLTASDVGALPSSTHIPSDPVQSNWTETNTGSLAYIKNKPTIPSKTSQLTNDSDFVTSSGTVANATTASQVKLNNQNIIQYKSSTVNGYTIQDSQSNAIYIEGREAGSGDTGGVVITNDGVTAFGAGDVDGVFRVINEDNVSAGPVFKVMKNGTVYKNGNELRAIKYADYRWDGTMTEVSQQVKIPLSSFGSEITPSNVLNFIVIHWTGFQAFANADWADSTGLSCGLTCLKTGTGYAKIRCVYFV